MKKIISLISCFAMCAAFSAPVFADEEVGAEQTNGDVVLISEEVTEIPDDESIAPELPEFSDMPDNWTTQALKNAVKNGLLKGDGDKIMPDNNIKRSEMAAIIVRAFGATKEAENIDKYVDLDKDKWYYPEFSRAVAMKIFQGNDQNELKPEDNITFQECYTVISRLFITAGYENDPQITPPNKDVKCLEKFDDYNQVADWAKNNTANLVGYGFWNGIENKLMPTDYITRSEFAVLMDNIVTTYIDEPGTYADLPEGNVLVRSEGVTIDGLKTDGLIVVGDGVEGETVISNVESTELIVGRGGTLKVSGVINNITALTGNTVLDISKVTKRNGIFYLLASGAEIVVGDIVADM